MPTVPPSNYPKPLIYFRRLSNGIPETLDPADCNPSDMGVQLSSVPTWQIVGTPSMEFAIVGKGPQRSPSSTVLSVTADSIWSLQGSEVRVYLDHRVESDQDEPFNFLGTTDRCPLVFVGDIHEIRPVETPDNRWHAFSCAARGLVSRVERVPVVSPIDNGDSIRFNMNALLSEYQPTTAGKTIGEAIKMVLQSPGVAINLLKQGIGSRDLSGVQSIRFRSGGASPQVIPNYVLANGVWGLNLDAIISNAVTAELPDLTNSDLATMDLVTPFEFRIAGDNVVASIQQTLDAYSPNYGMIVLPSGLIRFFDMRKYKSMSLDTMNHPVDGFTYSKSTLASYSRVIVRGGPKITPYYCQWDTARNSSSNLDDSPDRNRVNGTLTENFASTGQTNLQAKTDYQHTDFKWGKVLLTDGDVYFKDVQGPDPLIPPADLPSNKIRIVVGGSTQISSTNEMKTWVENEMTMMDGSNETRRECRIVVTRSQMLNGVVVRQDAGEFLVTANDAMTTASGTCIITTSPNVDRSPPPTGSPYTYAYGFILYGYPKKGVAAWRKYKVSLDTLSSSSPLKLTQSGMTRVLGTVFTTPQPGLAYSNIGKDYTEASKGRNTSYPECLVEYRERSLNSQNQLIWTYRSFWSSFRIDPVNNSIILARPSVIDSGNQPQYATGYTGAYTDKSPPWDTNTANSLTPNQPFKIVPYNIKALLPVYEGTQESVYPHHYANGTISSGESESKVKTLYGIDRDLIVHIPDWYDNRDQAYADKYAKEIWDSVQQPQIEGGFAWVDGVPDPYALNSSNLPIQWDYRGLIDSVENNLPARRVQSFDITTTESCRPSTGSGVEDCSLLLISAEVRFQSGRKPFTVAGFSTAKPRASIPMHDFHSFEEHLARDPNNG